MKQLLHNNFKNTPFRTFFTHFWKNQDGFIDDNSDNILPSLSADTDY